MILWCLAVVAAVAAPTESDHRQPMHHGHTNRVAVGEAVGLHQAVPCERQNGRSCQIRMPPASTDRATLDQWYEDLQEYRERMRAGLSANPGGDFSAYDNADVQWAKSSFIQPQVMVHDRFLFDREANAWTVGRYLDDLEARYGGVDAVLLWQGYPNIGVDDRNQYDLIASLPRGADGVQAMVAAFQAKGVKVFWPYFKWDSGTRSAGAPDHITLVKAVIATGADGIHHARPAIPV